MHLIPNLTSSQMCSTIIENEREVALKILHRSLQWLAWLMSLVYAFFLYDILGDQVGTKHCLWAPILMLSVPIMATLWRRWRRNRNRQRQYASQASQTSQAREDIKAKSSVHDRAETMFGQVQGQHGTHVEFGIQDAELDNKIKSASGSSNTTTTNININSSSGISPSSRLGTSYSRWLFGSARAPSDLSPRASVYDLNSSF